MELRAQTKLLEINHDFYKRYASSFSATRHQVQPGVQSLIPRIITSTSILDVGCGNGTLARALAANGYQGEYLGIDMSQDLLSKAIRMSKKTPPGCFNFLQVNLVDPNWHENLPETYFDCLVAFAVLHHLPGEKLRWGTIRKFASLISKSGYVAVSVWQWQNSPRLQKRVVDWSSVDLQQKDLDDGDVLLDWRANETIGLRYVHTFNENDLSSLAESAGFQVIDNFYSDGKIGNLALYQIWQLKN